MVLRHVSLDYVYVQEGLALKLPADAETLIEGPRGPVFLNLEGTVVNLNGSLDERYREWRRILRQIYTIETGA